MSHQQIKTSTAYLSAYMKGRESFGKDILCPYMCNSFTKTFIKRWNEGREDAKNGIPIKYYAIPVRYLRTE